MAPRGRGYEDDDDYDDEEGGGGFYDDDDDEDLRGEEETEERFVQLRVRYATDVPKVREAGGCPFKSIRLHGGHAWGRMHRGGWRGGIPSDLGHKGTGERDINRVGLNKGGTPLI